MTPFRSLRLQIGWPCQHVADRLEMSERTVRRWDAGDVDCPQRVLTWLEAVADAVESIPTPTK